MYILGTTCIHSPNPWFLTSTDTFFPIQQLWVTEIFANESMRKSVHQLMIIALARKCSLSGENVAGDNVWRGLTHQPMGV